MSSVFKLSKKVEPDDKVWKQSTKMQKDFRIYSDRSSQRS